MGFFKKVFKGAGKALKAVGKVAGTVVKVASPALGLIPVVGPIASKIVDKLPLGLLATADKAIQSDAIQHVIAASAAPALPRPEALLVAKEAKQDMLVKTGNSLLADQVGQATYEAATSPQLETVHINDLGKVLAQATVSKSGTVDANAPQTPEEKAKTDSLLKQVLNGALNGAKEGAISAFADTPQGQDLQKDAIEVQVKKYLPLALGGVIAYLLIKKR